MRYDRRGLTIYRVEDDGHCSVMFHLHEGSTTNQIENADAAISMMNSEENALDRVKE